MLCLQQAEERISVRILAKLGKEDSSIVFALHKGMDGVAVLDEDSK